MYKTKLQELCHQKRWGLPEYSALRDGPDHDPRFKASVSVNATSFHSPSSCSSSKQAHNDAAKLAYLHFTAPSPSSVSMAPLVISRPCDRVPEVDKKSLDHNSNTSGVGKNGSSITQPNDGGPKIGESCQSQDIHSDPLGATENEGSEKICQFKNQLQNYAQWKRFDLPLYSVKSEGPPHALQYKATVTVAGRTFESSVMCNTPEEAEHAASKAALMSLLLDSFPKNNSGSYKNLLLELTQKEGFLMPKYKTTRAGPPHRLTFLSTVEVEGEMYSGEAANSKKQAELNAAIVAYTAIIERGLGSSSKLMFPNLLACEALETSTCTGLVRTVDSHHNLKDECRSTSTPGIKHEEHDKESKAQEVVNTADICVENSSAYRLVQHVDDGTSSVCSKSVPSTPAEESSSSSAMLKVPNLSALAISDGNTRKSTKTSSYLLCNRFRVYPYYPDTKFPEGITVLPISDDKWVAVSLEFPHETVN